MIIAIPASANIVQANVDVRFGRCPYFCLYNTENKVYEFKKNEFANDGEGVGSQVVEFLSNKNVKEIYAVEVGPKAKILLDKLNINTRIIKSGQTIKQLIDMLNP